MLYHISEQPGIERFDPLPAPDVAYPVVWAINAERIRNYLFPRDCPRVTFFAGPNTSPADIDRFLGDAGQTVVAFETVWLERVRQTKLYCYHLPEKTFECVDRCAGYFHSRTPVVPQHVEMISDLLTALADKSVEIRVMPSLWTLRDAVVPSTLEYSIIRMRNAAPRAAK